MSRLFVNDDFQCCVTRLYHEGYRFGEATERDARDYVRRLRGTQTTDFIFNVNAQLSYAPSEIWQTAGDKYLKETENGEPVDFKASYLRVWYDLFVRQGVDLYAVWIEELRGMGIRPWMSFRMNDTHDNGVMSGGIRRSDYTYAARGRGLSRMRHREKSGYYDDCLDFALDEVRRHHLDYIREQLDRYDVDGVELDWMREPFCFAPGGEMEGAAILTDFMRAVAALVHEAEARYGHKILLGVRVLRDPQNTLDLGLDVFAWAREGLVDWVVPTPRWETADSDMPVALWRAVLPPSVGLAMGTDIRYMARPGSGCVMMTPELIAGLSMQALSGGADGVYLFNYTYLPDAALEALNYIGDRETLSRHARRYVVSFQDIACPFNRPSRPLPMPLEDNTVSPGWSALAIQTGEVDGRVTLRLGFSKGLTAADVRVFMNGAPCRLIGHAESTESHGASGAHPLAFGGESASLCETDVWEYAPECVKQGRQVIELKADSGTLDYAEIRVDPE